VLQISTKPTTTHDSPFGLRSLCRIVFRHWRKSAVFLCLSLAAGGAYIRFCPATYRSEAKLSVRLGRENVTFDPTALTEPSSVFSVPPSREDQLNTVAEILKSRVMAERVVDDLGPATVLGLPAVSGGTGDVDPRVRDRAVEHLSRSLNASTIRKSNLITATYDAASPAAAQRVLNRLIELYLEEHLRLNRSMDAHRFLEEETRRIKAELTATEERLRDLKNSTGLTSPEGQRRLLVERIGRLDDALLAADAALAASQAKVGQLEADRNALPETQVTAQTSGVGNEGTDSMRSQLYALQIREQQLLAKYTERHPLLQEVRQQAAEAAKALAREENTRTQITTGPNKARERVQNALLAEKPVLVSLESQAISLRRQLADVRGELKTLNEAELQITSLQREIQLLETNYKRYAVNLEQARIDQTMETQRISSLNVVQPAAAVLRPVHPNKLRAAILSLAVGLFGALGIALAAERYDPILRTPEQVERLLGVPALVSIPRVQTRARAYEHN